MDDRQELFPVKCRQTLKTFYRSGPRSRLRIGLFVLLVFMILAPTTFTMTIDTGRSISIGESRTSLMSAFQAVQRADRSGAPADQVASLSNQLNIALGYYDKAQELSSEGNATGAEYYSTLSNTASTLVLDKANAFQAQADSDRTTKQLLAYATAIVAAILSSLLVLEFHRVPNYLKRRRLLRTRLGPGDSSGQKN